MTHTTRRDTQVNFSPLYLKYTKTRLSTVVFCPLTYNNHQGPHPPSTIVNGTLVRPKTQSTPYLGSQHIFSLIVEITILDRTRIQTLLQRVSKRRFNLNGQTSVRLIDFLFRDTNFLLQKGTTRRNTLDLTFLSYNKLPWFKGHSSSFSNMKRTCDLKY